MLGLRAATIAPLDRVEVVPLFSRVVVGIDFGPASLAAARWAFEHVARDADAILLHVAVPPDESREPLTPALTGGLGGFAATLAVPDTHTVVRVGRPSQWLPALATGAEASLMVLGRRSNANRRRIGEPNVIERVTRRTNASVLVVPEGVRVAPTHVVAAVDGGESGRDVVRTASAIAERHGYGLIILHVVPPATGAYTRIPDSARRRPSIERADHAGAGEYEKAHGSRVVKSIPGDPVREIMAEAHRLGAALIVVGKRGEDEAPVGSVGSVARELLTSAAVPVLAVDTPA